MFAVKATYGNETRKFTFPDSATFPTYLEIHQQVCYLRQSLATTQRSPPPSSVGYFLSAVIIIYLGLFSLPTHPSLGAF